MYLLLLRSNNTHKAWVVSEDVTFTYLSEVWRLQKTTHGDKSVGYFSQEVDKHGNVLRQYPMSFWQYKQKRLAATTSRSEARS